MRCVRALVLWPLSTLLAGCAGALSEGESQFDEGQYPAAKETFAGLEGQRAAWGPPMQARYALLRGLTHEALGDRMRASEWLREAKAIEDVHPGSLSPLDVRRLRLGLDGLE